MKQTLITILLSVMVTLCSAQVQCFMEGNVSVGASPEAKLYSVKASAGYASKVYIGFGAALDIYTIGYVMPLTLDVRSNFKGNIAPMVSISAGYSLPLSGRNRTAGAIINPAIGASAKVGECRVYLLVGYKAQTQEERVLYMTAEPGGTVVKSWYVQDASIAAFCLIAGFQF